MGVRSAWHKRKNAFRNPVYLAYILAGSALFWLGSTIAASGVGPLEVAIFRAFNSLGGSLYWLMILFSLPGTIGMVAVVSIVVLAQRHYANFFKVILAGGGAYFLALFFKDFGIRARPYELISNVFVRESAIGANGYPSGHVAVATAVAVVTYQYIPRRYHKFVTLTVVMVAVSRLYLGMHFPVDLLGGYALGLAVGSLVAFVIGTTRDFGVTPGAIRKYMRRLGLPVAEVKAASVDARGSKPFFATMDDGSKQFIKVVGSDNNVADWLFKLWRRIIYRRLEDEVPFLTPKRQLEHEAYVAGLAYANGIRTPKIIGVFRVGHQKWAQSQESIAGKSLDSTNPEVISDQVLAQIWQQVGLLHAANIAHRDLRAANVFLDEQSKPWLIDFGFSEASCAADAKICDNVELMGSLVPLVSVERSVQAAHQALGTDGLKQMSPYLSYAVLSSATTKLLKREKSLPQLQAAVHSYTKEDDLKLKRMTRVNKKSILIIAAMLLALYVFIPQIKEFKQSYHALGDASLPLLGLALLFSIGTYFAAALVVKIIALFPLRYFKTLLVQLASTFSNRLLPAGAGNIATTSRYLMKEHHTAVQAGSVAALNNIIGLLGNMILLVIVVIFSHTPLNKVVRVSLPGWTVLLIAIGLITAVVVLFNYPKLRHKIRTVLRSALLDLQNLARKPVRLLSALSTSVALTALYALTLYASAHALGVNLSVIQTFFVFTVGVAAASITPTPGGLGGAEAGLVAAMVSVGVPSELGLPVALVYRFFTYWLPILPGFICFQIALRRKYI